MITAIDTDFLRPRETKHYPPDNEIPFEEWFLDNYDETRNKSDRIYLPILVTELNKQLRNRKIARKVDEYFQNLDKSKKYFLIVQHDDGVLFNLHGADVKIFGMGCKGDVQLPLVCQPHKYEFKENGRPIFASFIGSITHPIRERLVKELQGKEGYFISTEPTSLHSYCYIMSMSKYVLCCRGYGKTSFRIQEALQYRAIPIYISDEFLFNEGCITCSLDDVIKESNDVFATDYPSYYDWYGNLYTFSAVANMIYENLFAI